MKFSLLHMNLKNTARGVTAVVVLVAHIVDDVDLVGTLWYLATGWYGSDILAAETVWHI